MSNEMHLNHLGREVKPALELAIAAMAPAALVDRHAIAAGLLEAIRDLLAEDDQLPLIARTRERAHQALADWARWRTEHPPRIVA
jgi:hypothetical protein